MSPSKDELRHDDLHRTAEQMRERLSGTLDELDRRRHEMFDVKAQVRKHVGLLAGVGATAGAVLLSSGAVAMYRSRHRKQVVLRERAQALLRAWRHPDRVARQGERSILEEVGRRVVVSLVTAAAVEAGRLAIRKVMQRRQERTSGGPSGPA